ncbi:hypothetical protein Tco_0937623 [Tanacetum coccineum]|uniref:Uncharacterized protein n=1 Tax=Tanacetum coccineum TaxID=301880 RepID=A0ABQ5DGR3_9ASTR
MFATNIGYKTEEIEAKETVKKESLPPRCPENLYASVLVHHQQALFILPIQDWQEKVHSKCGSIQRNLPDMLGNRYLRKGQKKQSQNDQTEHENGKSMKQKSTVKAEAKIEETLNGPTPSSTRGYTRLLHKLLKDVQVISEELADYIKSPKWNRLAFYEDDDEEYTIAITLVLPIEEPDNSLSMRDEQLSTISETKSNELIKSSIENLVPIPSESEDFSDIESDDDESFSDEDVPKEIYSNPLFDEEIISTKIDPHHFNAESDLIESLLNQDTSIISYPKIDSLLKEFSGELAHIDLIPPGINEADFDPEEDIRLIEKLLYDNSSPQPPKEFNSKNSNAIIESFSPSPIPVEDSDSLMEEIDLFLTPDDSMPPGIENDDYDSEWDFLFLEELLSNDSPSLPENESFHFDVPSSPRPPAKPPDNGIYFEPDTGVFTKVVDDISDNSTRELIVHVPNVLPNLPILSPMFDTLLPFSSENEDKVLLLSHRGFKTFSLSFENPMMISGEDIPILDVSFLSSLTSLSIGDRVTDIKEKDTKSSQNEQNRAREWKEHKRSKSKLTKVKVKVNTEKSKSKTRPDNLKSLSSQQSQDKGKGILIEPVKKKDQILLDEETALNLQAEFDEEERVAREKAEKEQEANIALVETWDDIQAKIDVDHQLADRRVGKEKRARTELVQEITKKQKVEDDKETSKLKQLMKIISDEEEVAIDVIHLTVKSPSIVGSKIHKEGRKCYYQIMRVDGKSQMYMIFSQMLKSFDREDLKDLYKLVKAKYESTKPVEDLDLILWGDLKTMFEPHVEDKIYMLLEKKYPLAPLTLSMMLEKKLIIDYESEMAYHLLKFIMKQLKK